MSEGAAEGPVANTHQSLRTADSISEEGFTDTLGKSEGAAEGLIVNDGTSEGAVEGFAD